MENWVNRDIKISFKPSKALQELMDTAEKANDEGNWGYFNLADAIDIACKNLYTEGVITKHD